MQGGDARAIANVLTVSGLGMILGFILPALWKDPDKKKIRVVLGRWVGGARTDNG
jgi:hypothetical protein